MRFLVDENLPVDVVHALESDGHDVAYVSNTSLKESPDETIHEHAVRDGRILVTRDLDFPLRGASPLPGLILLRLPHSFTRPQIGRAMSWFIDQRVMAEVPGHIAVILPGRYRIGDFDS